MKINTIAQRTNIQIDSSYEDAVSALFRAQEKQIKEFLGKYPVEIDTKDPVFDIYMDNLPAGVDPRDYICITCTNNLNRFGNLAFIAENGEICPVMFPHLEGDNPWFATFNAIGDILRAGSSWTQRTYDSEEIDTIGKVTNYSTKSARGYFTHANLIEDPFGVYVSYRQVLTSFNGRSYLMNTGVIEKLIQQAVAEPDGFYLRENHLALLRRLQVMSESYNSTKNNWTREKLVLGNVDLVNSVVNSSVDQLLMKASGGRPSDIADAVKIYNQITDGARYQRAEKEASDRQLKLFGQWLDERGMMGSIKRRVARLDELDLYWTTEYDVSVAEPETTEDKTRAFFGGAKPDTDEVTKSIRFISSAGPTITITEREFIEHLLPKARRIVFINTSGASTWTAPFATTTDDPNAPPILQWDTPTNRNPIDFIYNKLYSISVPDRIEVSGVWVDPSHRQTDGVNADSAYLFAFRHYDTRLCNQYKVSNGLWAESVKPELYQFRRAIETFNGKNCLSPNPDGEIVFLSQLTINITVAVLVEEKWQFYNIVRNTGFAIQQGLDFKY